MGKRSNTICVEFAVASESRWPGYGKTYRTNFWLCGKSWGKLLFINKPQRAVCFSYCHVFFVCVNLVQSGDQGDNVSGMKDTGNIKPKTRMITNERFSVGRDKTACKLSLKHYLYESNNHDSYSAWNSDGDINMNWLDVRLVFVAMLKC